MIFIFLLIIYAFIMNIIFYVFIPTHNIEDMDDFSDDFSDDYSDDYSGEETTQNLLKNNKEKWNII